jgi:hypothetical protein
VRDSKKRYIKIIFQLISYLIKLSARGVVVVVVVIVVFIVNNIK